MTRSISLTALLSVALGLTLVGCTRPTPAPPTPAPTPIPAIELNATSGSIKASGEILPASQAQLSLPAAGRVEEVAVRVGDVVAPGDLLVTLEDAAAEAAVAQAQAAVARARAQLVELEAGARSQAVAAAQARVDAAQAHLLQLSEGTRPEQIAAAEAAVAAATAAQKQLFRGPREEDRIAAEAELANARAARDQAQAAYDRVSWRSDIARLPESQQLQQATNNFQAAQARYDALFARPDAAMIAAAAAQVQQAQAALASLQDVATPGQIAAAEAEVRSAQAELELLQAGASAESIAVAAAVVSEAEAALLRAEADLSARQLRAPMPGSVAALDINPGEMVLPGQVVVTVADLSKLQVETTDLSERDVARVQEGQEVVVFVKPLNRDVRGQVLRIAPQATVIGGDVVYAVLIDLLEQPADLRWGMSVDVEILAD